jgi:hypothetical protein
MHYTTRVGGWGTTRTEAAALFAVFERACPELSRRVRTRRPIAREISLLASSRGLAHVSFCRPHVQVLRVLCEERESEMPAPSGFDHASHNKSTSTRSIAAHPFGKFRAGSVVSR